MVDSSNTGTNNTTRVLTALANHFQQVVQNASQKLHEMNRNGSKHEKVANVQATETSTDC
ncbi:MAG: hypothetical protein CMJ20_12365 [Phycisphaeraceae bacterium]|nr:hypothetical protein [Phycisphaeraceae bacterium]